MEVLFISIYPAPNLQQSGRLADISLFCLHGCRLHSCSERPALAGVWSPAESLGQASFSSWNLCSKNKNPPPDRFRRWVSRITRYDSRVFSPRRQETHTYSRYNRGKPAWSSGRRKSFNESTETALRSQCSNCRCSIKSRWRRGPILAVNWEARGRIVPPIWTLQRSGRGFLQTGGADPFKVLKRWEDRCLASICVDAL